MAWCKKCGKKGLFLHINKQGLCNTCAIIAKNKIPGKEKQLKEFILKQQEDDKIANEQILRLNEARNRYETSGEYDKLIAIYEDVFSNPTPWNSATHKLYLVGFYQKNGQNDKAWALLNAIILEYPNEAYRVRRTQYRQLKKEKNYLEALKMFFLYKFNDCKAITCWSNVKESEVASFLKETQMLAKKANLDVNTVSKLADVFVNLIENPRSTEVTALKKFNEWYSSIAK